MEKIYRKGMTKEMSASAQNITSNYGQLTDEELVERFKSGDRKSLDVLIGGYLPKTHRKVCSLVPEPDVEDVEQEIFLSFMKSIYNFRISQSFAAWFATITARRIADYYRQKYRERDRLTEDQHLPKAKVDDPWKKLDDEWTVEEALVEIPEIYREVLSLKFSEDLSLGEISEKLGLTYEAARSRYRRGIGMLKEKMKEF